MQFTCSAHAVDAVKQAVGSSQQLSANVLTGCMEPWGLSLRALTQEEVAQHGVACIVLAAGQPEAAGEKGQCQRPIPVAVAPGVMGPFAPLFGDFLPNICAFGEQARRGF